MDLGLQDKVAIVAAASRGPGRAGAAAPARGGNPAAVYHINIRLCLYLSHEPEENRHLPESQERRHVRDAHFRLSGLDLNNFKFWIGEYNRGAKTPAP